MSQKFNTVIVGAGQGGLATSYFLKQLGHNHILLEQADRPAPVWQDGRWDSFTLVTPNWAFRLPGAEYQGDQPQEFMAREEIVERFSQYPKTFQLPVRYNTQMTSVTWDKDQNTFVVKTNSDTFTAENVVIATGLFQRPRLPACAQAMPSHLLQLHSGAYRNPQQLPEGAVLVVGSSQSGCQIAKEIQDSGRQVYLCVGKSGRAPRRYRGKDGSEWLDLLGLSDRTVDALPSPKVKFAANPHVAGRTNGPVMNLHQFAQDGMVLLGHLLNVEEGILKIAPDLHDNLTLADNFEKNLTGQIDLYIANNGLDLPPETLPNLQHGFSLAPTTEVDLQVANIQAVIWAVGYDFDFNNVHFPIFDEDGYPIHKRGITEVPGLFFVGLPWLHKQKSGLISGVGDDAAYVVQAISQRQLKGEANEYDLENTDAAMPS